MRPSERYLSAARKAQVWIKEHYKGAEVDKDSREKL